MRRLLLRTVGVLAIAGLIATDSVALNFTKDQFIMAAAVWQLGLLSPTAIALATKQFGSPNLIPDIMMRLDVNGDGMIGFDEVLGADVLAVSRAVIADLGLDNQTQGRRSPKIGDDAMLRRIVNDARNRVAADLALGLPFEDLPTVPAHGQPGTQQGTEPAQFLAAVPSLDAAGSLTILNALVNDLDLGNDFVSRNASTNVSRRRMLTEGVAKSQLDLAAGLLPAVQMELLEMRSHVERHDDEAPQAWIDGPRAARIRAQIDITLALMNQR